MKTFFQQLVNGAAIGSQYAIWAVGYGLVYQVLGLFNFAHGDSVILPVFVAVTLILSGVPVIVAALAAVVLGAVVAVSIERAVFRPLLRRNQAFLGFVAALAIATVLRNIVSEVWGVTTRIFPAELPRRTFVIAEIRVTSASIINLSVAVVVVGLFQLYLRYFRSGQAILAVAQDREAAAMMGIPVDRIIALVYGLSGAIGVVGALLYVANVKVLTAGIGFSITLRAFIATVLGGIGTVKGAVAGGLLLGIAEAMIISYVTTQLLNALLFTLLALFLVFRPNGLMGRKITVKL